MHIHRVIMYVLYVLILTCTVLVSGHEYYNGVCPQFTPMDGWHWGDFQGEWRVAFKMNSRSSCIRYTFSQVGNRRWVSCSHYNQYILQLHFPAYRSVAEEKLLPVLGRFGVPSAVTSRGTLTQVSSNTAEMWVRWDTGVLREAMFSRMKYLVLDTDYKTKALVCSCQDLNIGLFAVNRRSCDFLIVS